MKVKLRELKPNPFRDFEVDPIDEDNPEIEQSISDTGFWGGTLCRQTSHGIEIAAGHRRWKAAMKAGVEIADLTVGNFDDETMIRIYQTENATQRGNTGTAITGSVASALRYLLKLALTSNERFVQFCTNLDVATVVGNITSDKKGMGRMVIAKFFNGAMKESDINHQLANLKTSGHYARIVREVNAEIEQERLEAEEEAKKARKAAEKEKAVAAKARAEREAAAAQAKADKAKEAAAKSQKATESVNGTEVTFDYEGVSKHFKDELHVRTFREMATSDYVKPYLPVEKQALLAKTMAENNKEITGTYIRENMVGLVKAAKGYGTLITKQQIKELEESDVREKMINLQHHFSRNAKGVKDDWEAIIKIMDKHKTTTFELTPEFVKTLDYLRKINWDEVEGKLGEVIETMSL
jgi:hypothetical protein